MMSIIVFLALASVCSAAVVRQFGNFGGAFGGFDINDLDFGNFGNNDILPAPSPVDGDPGSPFVGGGFFPGKGNGGDGNNGEGGGGDDDDGEGGGGEDDGGKGKGKGTGANPFFGAVGQGDLSAVSDDIGASFGLPPGFGRVPSFGKGFGGNFGFRR